MFDVPTRPIFGHIFTCVVVCSCVASSWGNAGPGSSWVLHLSLAPQSSAVPTQAQTWEEMREERGGTSLELDLWCTSPPLTQDLKPAQVIYLYQFPLYHLKNLFAHVFIIIIVYLFYTKNARRKNQKSPLWRSDHTSLATSVHHSSQIRNLNYWMSVKQNSGGVKLLFKITGTKAARWNSQILDIDNVYSFLQASRYSPTLACRSPLQWTAPTPR